jgi:hypothetical protein
MKGSLIKQANSNKDSRSSHAVILEMVLSQIV